MRARPTTAAPRLRTLDGARLGLYLARPGGSSKQTEASVYGLVRAVGALIAQRHNLAGVREWRRRRAGVRNEEALLRGVAGACDAVVYGIGDCHHGSACSLTEVFALEQLGVPVAYIDTPRRVPRVTRDGGAFTVDYFRLEERVGRWKRRGGVERLSLEFELQGIHRALRMAGAEPGDTVRVGAHTLELWEYPDPTWMRSEGTDGLDGYDYVLTDPLDTDHPARNVARARDLYPRVVAALTSSC